MTYIYYTCYCGFYVKVVGEIDRLTGMVDKEYYCPDCRNPLLTLKKRKSDGSEPYDLTVEEFIDAINGLGMPDETVTHIEPVVAMLKVSPVVDVAAFERAGRCIIKSITLDNGVTLHLASSGYGAAVYKATRRKHADSRSRQRSNEQQIRGRGAAEEHSTRSGSGGAVCSEVHGRLWEHSDEICSYDERPTVLVTDGRLWAGPSSSEMVPGADDGEVGPASEEDDKD